MFIFNLFLRATSISEFYTVKCHPWNIKLIIISIVIIIIISNTSCFYDTEIKWAVFIEAQCTLEKKIKYKIDLTYSKLRYFLYNIHSGTEWCAYNLVLFVARLIQIHPPWMAILKMRQRNLVHLRTPEHILPLTQPQHLPQQEHHGVPGLLALQGEA